MARLHGERPATAVQELDHCETTRDSNQVKSSQVKSNPDERPSCTSAAAAAQEDHAVAS
jgi:hypothetical protein